MKKKTIEKELKKVHQKWCNSIDDEKVKELAEKNTIITGGAIVSMLLKEDVNDYDLYFKNKETVIAICNYYKKKVIEITEKNKLSVPDINVEEINNRIKILIKSTGLIQLDGRKLNHYDPIFITSNAITLKGEVQLIFRFYGTPEEIHSNYDFEHTKSYWESNNKKLVILSNSAEALLTKELKYTGSKYPLSSIIRTRKFIRRGWTINAGEYLKMIIQLNNLDLLNIDILEDQLVGVDISYFVTFISDVREKMKDPDFKLTNSYIIDTIDKIFNEHPKDDT